MSPGSPWRYLAVSGANSETQISKPGVFIEKQYRNWESKQTAAVLRTLLFNSPKVLLRNISRAKRVFKIQVLDLDTNL